MKFSSTRDASDRAGGGVTRHTLVKADDTHFMQEHQIQGFAGEEAQGIEHPHDYGFTNVPNDQVQGSKQAAEGFVAHLGGNRSHGVVLKMGDRRYRLIALGKGDVALHRDDGQQVHMQSDGMWVSAPSGKKITHQVMEASSMPDAPQPPGASAKMGQGKQAGKANVTKVVLDKDHVSLHHVATGNIIWTDKDGVHSTVAIDVRSYPFSD